MATETNYHHQYKESIKVQYTIQIEEDKILMLATIFILKQAADLKTRVTKL